MKSDRRWWHRAVAAGCVASLLLGWSVLHFILRTAGCADTFFVAASGPLGDRALSLPVLATPIHARIEGKPGGTDQIPNPRVEGARLYDLGPFRLRVKTSHEGWNPWGVEAPLFETVTLEAPLACERADFVLETGSPAPTRDEAAKTITLRRDEPRDSYVVTFSPLGGIGDGRGYELVHPRGAKAPVMGVVAFRTTGGPFPYPLWRALLVAGPALVIVAFIHLLRSGAYFRPRGIWRWRQGRLSVGNCIEPDDGGDRLLAENLGAAVGALVVFTEGATLLSTYRTANGRRAARVLVGSHPELALLYGGSARLASALFAVASAVLLLSILVQ
jgi:hypothetical protein